MNDEFELLESQAQSPFDVKAFLIRALSYWKWFVLCIGLGIFIVYQQNIRKQQSYRLSTQISIEDDKNPLFTSNTSLTFNWGGVSGKVKTIMTTLQSRSHHEKVVDTLAFYKKYLKQSRFRKDDIYKAAPFEISLTPNTYQVLNHPIKVTFLGGDKLEIQTEFESPTLRTQNFDTKEHETISATNGVKTYPATLGEPINLPFLKGTITKRDKRDFNAGDEYYIEFSDFDAVVRNYKNKLKIDNPINSAILNLSMTDVNTAKIVDYLNKTVDILRKDQLDKKNLFVTNTIAFIDKQLAREKENLISRTDSLNNYREKNKIFNLDEESIQINEKLSELETESDNIKRKIAYYRSLKTYLETSNSFTELPAPSIAGIDDTNILNNIAKINALSVQKSKYESTVRSDASVFVDLDNQIEALKSVLLENISSATSGLRRELNFVNGKIGQSTSKIKKLPKDQQQLLTIQRQYALSEQTYNMFLAKRGEADIIKSASVSDVQVVDPAKDTGAIPIDLKLSARYIFAFLGGLIIPLLVAFLVTFFDNKLHNPQSLEKLSKIPLLGVIGKNTTVNNLAVHLKPKSTVAEAFRGLRSSLQYMYKKQANESCKTIMLTSSVSGEGKTFCSINLATVFALSGKKTILVGLDLRKPKIFDDFEIKNNIGSVNYLIGQKSLEEITQQTKSRI